MARDSSSASASLERKMELPLVICSSCRCRRIVELTAMTAKNYGRIFYTCPNHKRDGTGCRFWFWEEDYISYLKEKKLLANEETQAMEGDENREETKMKLEHNKGNQESKMAQACTTEQPKEKELMPFLVVAAEIAWLLKMVVGLLVMILVVLQFQLFAQLKN